MIDLRNISFGGPAALVTSMGLIVGLGSATAPKSTMVGSLLIVALADNLTDALRVHIYQEAERLPERKTLRTTVANFFARLLTALSFVAIVLVFPTASAIPLSVAWGFVLLCGLSYLLARARSIGVLAESGKHGAAAVVVIAASRAVGAWARHLS